MPRPKSYDRQDAIVKACAAFWEHGFQALGVRELEQITGINQFAIRSEFGGKEGLYLEALAYYSSTAVTEEMAPMLDGDISDILAFLRGLVTPGSMTSSAYGCLIVNTGVENARVKSPRLAQAVHAYWGTLERHFQTALKNEKERQSDAASFDPAPVARALVAAVMGIHAQNRAQGDQTAGHDLVNFLVSMLSDLRVPK